MVLVESSTWMRASNEKPPMLDRTARHFPIHITDPESVHTDHVYIEDLEALGLWEVDQRTFVRALCTIGTEIPGVLLDEETNLEAVHATDRCTSWLVFENGIEYQVEFFLDGLGFGFSTDLVSVMNSLTRNEDTRLLLVCDIAPTGSTKTDIDAAETVDTYPVITEPREILHR